MHKIAVNKAAVTEDFFKLSTGLAGDIVQKFVNYHVRFAIIGDFSGYTSKPLHDYIYECNQGNHLNFVAIIFIVGIACACYIGSFSRLLDLDDMMYADYIRAAGGEITERTYEYRDNEQMRFNEVNQELTDLSQMFAAGDISANTYNAEYAFVSQKLMGERSFNRMASQLNIVSANEKAELIYDTGYAKLTAAGGILNDIIPALFILFLLILCVSPIYSSDYESGVFIIIRSTKNGGKQLLKKRILIAVSMAAFLSIAVYGAEFWQIISLYGAQNLASPVQSLTNLVDFLLEVSIGGYLLLINVARMLLFALTSMMILAISNYCKKTVASVMISAALLGIPLLVFCVIVR